MGGSGRPYLGRALLFPCKSLLWPSVGGGALPTTLTHDPTPQVRRQFPCACSGASIIASIFSPLCAFQPPSQGKAFFFHATSDFLFFTRKWKHSRTTGKFVEFVLTAGCGLLPSFDHRTGSHPSTPPPSRQCTIPVGTEVPRLAFVTNNRILDEPSSGSAEDPTQEHPVAPHMCEGCIWEHSGIGLSFVFIHMYGIPLILGQGFWFQRTCHSGCLSLQRIRQSCLILARFFVHMSVYLCVNAFTFSKNDPVI